MARTSTPWALLPAKELGCGSATTCWRRLDEWAKAGVFDQLQALLLDELGEAGRIDLGRVSVDSFSLRAANANDSTMFEAVLDDIPAIRMPTGRRRRRPGKVHGDKAYDHRRCRAYLRRRGIRPRIARRMIESSDRLGRHRWMIERTGAWLGGFRRLRIRYERGSERFYALAMLACSVICDGNACSRHVVREAGTGRLAAAVVWPACRLRAGFRLVARRLDAATRRAGGPNVEKAIEVLKALIAELDDRYLTLLANRARKVEH